MTLSRVSVTNATHRVVWCMIGQVELSLPAVLLSPPVVPPQGPPDSPHKALSSPLQSFSQRSPPPEPWKLNGDTGHFTGSCGHCTIIDPLSDGIFLRNLALYRRRLVLLLLKFSHTRRSTQTPAACLLAGKTVEFIHSEKRGLPDEAWKPQLPPDTACRP